VALGVKPPYRFSVTIGANCARQLRTFADLAEKLEMPVEDLMRQCNGKVSPSKALVKGLAKELGVDETWRSLRRKCGRILGNTTQMTDFITSVLSPFRRIASKT
jgi:hypothetical protein